MSLTLVFTLCYIEQTEIYHARDSRSRKLYMCVYVFVYFKSYGKEKVLPKQEQKRREGEGKKKVRGR